MVADLLASKQGLVKDPAANQIFADCEDMRTKIQTKLERFVQDELKDHQNKAANAAVTAISAGRLMGDRLVPQ